MGSLFEFFDFIVDIIEELENRRLKKRSALRSDPVSEKLRIPVFEYGVMSGFIGSVSALSLFIGSILLFGFQIRRISQQVCYWQTISLPIGIVLGIVGKASSEWIRQRYDIWQFNSYEFSIITIVTFSFLGTFIFTILLYIVDLV